MAKLASLSGPHFAFDKYDLSSEGGAKVRAVSELLKKYPKRRVQVNGFTDSFGTEAHNLELSNRRANAVRDDLVADGVSPGRITTRGYGTSNPVASNATAEGRAHNRRVEIILE